MAKVVTTSGFEKDAKPLFKKYHSFGDDFEKLIQLLQTNPKLGTSLGLDCFKIRLAISSKGKGKSGGARVITCFKLTQETVILLSIYDKSDRETITQKQLKALLKEADLLKP